MKIRNTKSPLARLVGLALMLSMASSNSFGQSTSSKEEAVKQDLIKGYANLRLRLEDVSQNNPLEDAQALTLRTRVGVNIAEKYAFSGVIEFEDVRDAFGINDYSVPPAGVRPGQFSVIADPETTELDQAYVKWRSGNFEVKAGRQAITHDAHRFIGDVGFRQDRQTFDALSLKYKHESGAVFEAAQVFKRNRIFAEEADIDSQDTLLRTQFQTPIGKLTGYGYLLESDNGTNNGLDTYGALLTGSKDNWSYKAELATQDNTNANRKISTEYVALESGWKVKKTTIKVGVEMLTSDGGQGGFATPLATLHKFNGWADSFLRTPDVGLQDFYGSVATPFLGGNLVLIYHDFRADDNQGLGNDLGSEINVQFKRKLGDRYAGVLRFASYDAGDSGYGYVDTDKFWAWIEGDFR